MTGNQQSAAHQSHRHSSNTNQEEEEFLTADRMALWLKENRVLQIVLKDSLHQPQYVEKLEKVIRFMIKARSLTLEDLHDIWNAQVDQHEAIVKNVHDLLAKLAWDFSPEQLDHLFECFQKSWSTANAKQREKLLELIRRLAEDDKDGMMADKVLTLFWNLAHSTDVSIEIMDQALSAHVKILDYSCTQYRETQKSRWLERCIEELKTNSSWVLPALKQIREICCLYPEVPPLNASQQQQKQQQPTIYRHDMIHQLQNKHALVILVADNLTRYVDSVRRNPPKVLEETDPADLYPDGRYNHLMQVQERLNFIRFLLKDGQLWLCSPQAKQIWNCLAENAVFPEDREACAKWFSKLMGEEPDLDPEINRDFYENNILQLDPSLVTENGIKCFDRFFKAVNCKANKLVAKRRAYLMNDTELIGLDYIWRLVLCSNQDIANSAIELLKETFTNLGPHLQANKVEIHEDFISSCMDRLKAPFDTISLLERGKDDSKFEQETTRLCRVMKVLHEYVQECDADYYEERAFVPLYRASRGKQLTLLFRFPNQGRQIEDVEIWTHTNDTLGAVRRQILQRLKGNPANVKLELFLNGDLIDPADDRKILLHLPLRDKTLLSGKLSPINSAQSGNGGQGIPASSPDSSSDSSTSSPQHQYETGPNVEVERCLPGVILSQQHSYCQFFLHLADLGCKLDNPQLRDGARALLKLMPPDLHSVRKMKTLCQDLALKSESSQQAFDSLFFLPSPSETLYNLEVCYSLLMPSTGALTEKAFDFQLSLAKARGIPAFIGMLTRNNFLSSADLNTKRLGFLYALKICKLLFCVAGHSLVHMVAEACHPDSKTQVTSTVHNQAVVLQQALQQIPSPTQEVMVRNISQRLATQLLDVGAQFLPDQSTVYAILRLAWASCSGNLDLANASTDELHEPFGHPKVAPESDDVALCREALEVLTLAIALHPQCMETLSKDKSWHLFIIDVLILSQVRGIRLTAADQFLLIATRCTGEQQPIRFFVTLLFTVLPTTATENAPQSGEYFALLSRLLVSASASNITMNAAESLLNNEIAWLKKIPQDVDDNLLEGHLGLCRDLLAFMSPEKKFEVGASNKSGINLIKDLIENFVFPASKMYTVYKQTEAMPMGHVSPICSSGQSLMAAFDLLVALCTGCLQNLTVVAHMLIEMFYVDKEDVVTEWEYLPPIGPRPQNGFVGLKNAGATCYMNSVLQQLFMIDSVRTGVLSVDGACTDPTEDFSGEDKDEGEFITSGKVSHWMVKLQFKSMLILAGDNTTTECDNYEQSRKTYNITILKQVQAIFGHLSTTKLQFYVPKGLWRHFRMQGEPVNLREQQDAVEFYVFLIDFVDTALKDLGHEKRMTKILGGVFSDQKICKTCPHRYSREEQFSVISVDVRNHSNLQDSLHEYVKGELLDGSNAYYCERCDKKVDTTKRLCVKKLPPILVIQLKRFDYDYDRECAVKFNDYFEFPRDLDMEPYTVGGLAKIEGEAIDCDPSDLSGKTVRKFKLRGMVVHSGQASGGHYYSYIRSKDERWYKFDDGDVSEAKMEDDEELRAQCYGGEYTSEVFDHLLKRMSYRKQKRWWNAYMLFYTRNDYQDMDLDEQMKALSLNTVPSQPLKIPSPIEKSIQKQNVRFLHHRNQFSAEYFQFMRKIIHCNVAYVQPPQSDPKALSLEAEEIALTTVQLASKFLFTSGFHTKKTLRGSTQEWYEMLTNYLRFSKKVRSWFCQKVLFETPSRFCEYILECPTAEVRTAFVRIIVFIAHFSLNDGPVPPPAFLQRHQQKQGLPALPSASLSDHLLQTILALLCMEVSDHGRHLSQYFQLFVMYAGLGSPEKSQLLKLNVPGKFIQVAMDEGPGPPIKYQYAELGKLYQVVSQLVRCCDVSSKCQSAVDNQAVLPNPYAESNGYIMPLQSGVNELIFGRYTYLKKLVEEANAQDDTKKLLQFCSWENPSFSHAVLLELLWQIAIVYTYELRPYLDLLLAILLMEDSWQSIRIQKTLKGIPEDHSLREGLFDIITRSKSHYQKRAYQCIKLLVQLFSQCQAAKQILDNSAETRRKWTWSVEWLNDELEKGRGGGGGGPYPGPYSSYSNWSPPAQSNETANGYFLERSHSARLTLEKACELLPEEVGFCRETLQIQFYTF